MRRPQALENAKRIFVEDETVAAPAPAGQRHDHRRAELVGRDQVIWAFGPDLEPVLEVEPGAVVRLETNDCFTGQIRSEEDLVTGIDFERINSATGPIAVAGAEPGDSLVVELLEVNPIEWGVATIIPGYGQLHEQVSRP